MNEYCYEEIELGQSEHFQVTITQNMFELFRELSGDTNPLHTQESYAKEKGFPGRVAYGMLTASFLSTMAGVYLPGKYSLIHTVETDFIKPVFAGDTLTVTGTVQKKSDAFRAIWLKISIENQTGERVCTAKMRIGVLQ